MRSVFSLFLLLAGGLFFETRAEPPLSVTRTFYVTGVECGACVYLVQLAASECKGVLRADVEQTADSYANVTFDPRLVSEQQIAQSIRGAMSLHGAPYLARLKIRVAEYAKHAAAMGLLFEQWRELVQCEVLDAAKGELMVHLLPLKVEASLGGAAGWSGTQFFAALKSGLPAAAVVEFAEEKAPGL
jgi:copper chaperone CopZ